jgi:hypothetical protein
VFRKKNKSENNNNNNNDGKFEDITVAALKSLLTNMHDAEIVERQKNKEQKVTLLYIKTLINQERLNECIIEPLIHCSKDRVLECITNAKVSEITTLSEAQEKIINGSILLNDSLDNTWWAVRLENQFNRSIQPSQTETIIYGPNVSFIEQIDQNIALIRKRIPLTSLKTESFTIGSLSKTTVVMMYIEGLTNPEYISLAKSKISNIDFDQFLDSSQVATFMEDHEHTVFPQYLQTDRPDSCAYSLGVGKIILLVDGTPFALIAPITLFHLFQSPEDYFLRWTIASFLRSLRFLSFIISITLIPLYVALTTHHYQMVPLQILFVLLESRSKLPFTPFWEAMLMLIVLEIIKEASLRMPTKTGQTLGVIGGIIIGEATVAAAFASKVLIVLIGISAIASFLVPNYLVTKSNALLQFVFLLLASILGIYGMVIGGALLLVHLVALTSLKQPYLAPFTPFYWGDWMDLFIRAPLTWVKSRPEHLHPLQKWRYSKRR